MVTPKEIKRFKAKYVSLYALAKERKLYIGTMKSKLDGAAGIQPAFDPRRSGRRFTRGERSVDCASTGVDTLG
jgi:hypothetical protein